MKFIKISVLLLLNVKKYFTIFYLIIYLHYAEIIFKPNTSGYDYELSHCASNNPNMHDLH